LAIHIDILAILSHFTKYMIWKYGLQIVYE
jgi:hypothetical protein